MPAINQPPQAGLGLHDWILDFTRRKLLSGLSEEYVYNLTSKLACEKGRPLGTLSREIRDAIAGARAWLDAHPYALTQPYRNGQRAECEWREDWWRLLPASEGIRRLPPAKRWSLPTNQPLIAKILRRKAPRLRSRSHLDLSELYADLNYPLVLAKTVSQPRSRPLDYWRARQLSDYQWMVASPCLQCGDGGWMKTDENAGERFWLIIEFDSGTLEDQSKLLWWLSRIGEEWELALIVYSGGKSLHGWFSCVGREERGEIFKFFRLATTLGCDKMMRSSVQYTRVPLGTNQKTGQRQSILHWSEEAISEHQRKVKENEYQVQKQVC